MAALAPASTSAMPRRDALCASPSMVLAAVESTNGTADRSITSARLVSAMRSSTEPMVDAAPKKKAPVMR